MHSSHHVAPPAAQQQPQHRFHSREGLLRFIKSLLQPLYTERRLTKENFISISKQTLHVIMSNHAYGGAAWSPSFVASALEMQLALLGIHQPFPQKMLVAIEWAGEKEPKKEREPEEASTLLRGGGKTAAGSENEDPIKNHLALLRHRLASKVASYASTSSSSLVAASPSAAAIRPQPVDSPAPLPSGSERQRQIRLSKQRMDEFYSSTPTSSSTLMHNTPIVAESTVASSSSGGQQVAVVYALDDNEKSDHGVATPLPSTRQEQQQQQQLPQDSFNSPQPRTPPPLPQAPRHETPQSTKIPNVPMTSLLDRLITYRNRAKEAPPSTSLSTREPLLSPSRRVQGHPASSPNRSRSVELMAASFLSSSKASQRELLERVLSAQLAVTERRREVLSEETLERQAVREEESAAFMMLMMGWAQLVVAWSLQEKHEKWQQQQISCSNAGGNQQREIGKQQEQQGGDVVIDLNVEEDGKEAHHRPLGQEDLSPDDDDDDPVPLPPAGPPPEDQIIFLDEDVYAAEQHYRQAQQRGNNNTTTTSDEEDKFFLDEVVGGGGSNRRSEIQQLVDRVHYKTQVLQRLQQRQQHGQKRRNNVTTSSNSKQQQSVSRNEYDGRSLPVMSGKSSKPSSSSSYVRDHFRNLHQEHVDVRDDNIDDSYNGSRNATGEPAEPTSPSIIRPKAIATALTTPTRPKRFPTTAATSDKKKKKELFPSPRMGMPLATASASGPTRKEVVEFIRIVLQPLYNRGELEAQVFANIVKVVSREFFSRPWKSGTHELDAQWKHFLHRRLSDLLGLREPSL